MITTWWENTTSSNKALQALLGIQTELLGVNWAHKTELTTNTNTQIKYRSLMTKIMVDLQAIKQEPSKTISMMTSKCQLILSQQSSMSKIELTHRFLMGITPLIKSKVKVPTKRTTSWFKLPTAMEIIFKTKKLSMARQRLSWPKATQMYLLQLITWQPLYRKRMAD